MFAVLQIHAQFTLHCRFDRRYQKAPLRLSRNSHDRDRKGLTNELITAGNTRKGSHFYYYAEFLEADLSTAAVLQISPLPLTYTHVREILSEDTPYTHHPAPLSGPSWLMADQG